MGSQEPQTTPEKIYELGLTAKGSELVSGDEFLAAFDYLKERRVYPHTVEAFEMIGDRERANIPYGILGLDRGVEEAPGKAQDKFFELAKKRIMESKRCKYEVKFKIWLDDFES